MLNYFKKNFELLQVWFYENHMILNPRKNHYLIINKDITNKSIEFHKNILYVKAQKNLFGLMIDTFLNFQIHLKSSKKRAN